MLDEPSLGLAPMVVPQIVAAIRALNRSKGLTVRLVERNTLQSKTACMRCGSPIAVMWP